MTVSIVREDGSSITDDDDVVPVNLLGAAMFNMAELWINNTLISSVGGGYYSYR